MMQSMFYTRVDSPIGELLLVGDGRSLHGLHMLDGPRPPQIAAGWERRDECFAPARRELEEYFAGDRTVFGLPLSMAGGAFDQLVWEQLRRIPYGETISYGELARRVGHPHAARAVGVANGRNPISVIVPCHRVIGADGSLTGYGGGLERKRLLLELEAGVLTLTP